MSQEDTSRDGSWKLEVGLKSDVVVDCDVFDAYPVIVGEEPEGVRFRYGWFLVGVHEGYCQDTTQVVAQRRWPLTPPRPGRYKIVIEAFRDDEYLKAERFATCIEDDTFHRPPLPSEDAETVVKVDDVSMVFNIANERYNSLKEYFIAAARGELKFKEFRALNHINFEVKRGEGFGLVGTNGSGKSTMLKIIAGVLSASEGSCTVRGTIAPLIELGAGFDYELTARENIYLNGALLGYRKEFIDEHYQEIVEFAELQDFVDMPLKNFSSGMVARIAFAIATITEPDILIVDEALSVGDMLFQKKCERRIKQYIESDGVTVLLVSHSLDLIQRTCDRVCWIEKGVQRMLGPTDEVCAAYQQFGA